MTQEELTQRITTLEQERAIGIERAERTAAYLQGKIDALKELLAPKITEGEEKS